MRSPDAMSRSKKYKARQYRPNYFNGFDNDVRSSLSFDDLITVPWCENFKHSGFKEFKIEPYGSGDELIISAHYEDGKHFVVGFALPEDSQQMSNNGDLLRDNWRYRPHQS